MIFIVWGARETVEGHTLPIRYHLAIDDKPKVGNQYSCFYFEDANKVKRAKYPIKFNSFKEFPIGEIEKSIYGRLQKKKKINHIQDIKLLYGIQKRLLY